MPTVENHIFSDTGGSAANSLTVDMPSGIVDGELLIVAISVIGAPAVSQASWNNRAEAASIQAGLALFTRVAASEPASYSFTWTGTPRKAEAVAIRASNHGGFDAALVTTSPTTGTSHTVPSATAAEDGSLRLSFSGMQGSVTVTNNDSMTDIGSGASTTGSQNGSIWAAQEAVDAGATGTKTWVHSGSTRGSLGTLIISPAAAGEDKTTNVSAQAGASAATTASKGGESNIFHSTEASTSDNSAKGVAVAAAHSGSLSIRSVAVKGAQAQSEYHEGAGGTTTHQAAEEENKSTSVVAQAGASSSASTIKAAEVVAEYQSEAAPSGQAAKGADVQQAYQAALNASNTHSADSPDLAEWEPPAGHQAFEWSEGAAWTDVTAADLGIDANTPDIATVIEAHIDVNREVRIRYVFPAGVFTLASQLNVNRDEKRIVGAGSSLTFFRATADGRIRFGGGDGSTSNLTAAPSRGDNQISVVDASVATVGETIAIKQTADDTVTGTDDNTSPYSVGTIAVEGFAEDPWAQIVEVTAVDTVGNTIDFTPALALDYDIGKTPYAKDFNNVIDASLEGFTLDVIEDQGVVAIEFDRVKNGYIHDVRVQNHSKYGISLRECFEVEISQCRIIHAQRLGTGGNGYGIHLQLATTRAYVHDCAIASDYRHAILVETGASHNIIAYNYVDLASAVDLTDLSIHGHYVHHNLFEGNVFHGCVEINDFYPETLQNVVFRNRILGNPNFWDATSRDYAFWIRRNSVAAIVANRCETLNVARVFDGSEASLIEANGSADSAPAWAGDSRYLSAAPTDPIWSGYTWPPFAGDTSNTIPAQDFDLSIAKVALVAHQAAVNAAIQADSLEVVNIISNLAFQAAPASWSAALKGALADIAGQESSYVSSATFKDCTSNLEYHSAGRGTVAEAKGGGANAAYQAAARFSAQPSKQIDVNILHQEGLNGSALHSPGFSSLVSVEGQAGANATVIVSKDVVSSVAYQAASLNSSISSKSAKILLEGQGGTQAYLTSEKGASSEINHRAGFNSAFTVSAGIVVSVFLEAHAGINTSVQSEKGAIVELELQEELLGEAAGQRGATASVAAIAGASITTQAIKAALSAVSYQRAGLYTITTVPGKTVQLAFQGGLSGQAAQEPILIPTIITLSLEHIHQIGLSIEDINRITIAVERLD